MKAVTFNDAIETVEALPEEQREALIEIVRHRLTEQRRDNLAKGIKKAKQEYALGKVKRGSVDDLMGQIAR